MATTPQVELFLVRIANSMVLASFASKRAVVGAQPPTDAKDCLQNVVSGLSWPSVSGRMQTLGCSGDKIADDEGCPPEDPNMTAFSLNESVRMMRYAYAAYYNKPEKHGLPSQIQVVHTFAYPLGLWDKAFGFVALDEVERKIVLAFRGSVTFTQLMVEIVYHTLVPWHGDKKIRVNEFFMWAADDLLPQITPVLQRLFKQCSDCQLHVTGHSLGASVAMFAAYNISFWSPRPPILYTFGQPRSSNGAFARMVEERLPIFFRVVNAADPVPHIPLCTRSFDEVPLDDHNFATISESYSTWPSENGRASEATVLVSRIEEALERAQNFMDVLERELDSVKCQSESPSSSSSGSPSHESSRQKQQAALLGLIASQSGFLLALVDECMEELSCQ
eukprot:symbB.v1.2.019192.t1/scaffold1512.1/size114451/3